MMKKKGNLIFVGIVASGKSSFIAALWHVVESGELNSSLQITSLPAQREYLNALRTTWLNCGDLGRTVSEFGREIFLNIKTEKSNELDLVFPDLDGELYESHFANRFISPEFVKKLHASSDIVLFVNPDNLKKGDLIAIADHAIDKSQPIDTDNEAVENRANEERVEEVKSDANENSNRSGQPDLRELEWDPKKHTPTQVILVDLLQMILEYIEKPKISVIISAWDLIMSIPNNKKTPPAWLTSELPLLNQFLEANDDRITYKIFGVSAQGLDYTDEVQKKTLQDEDVPSNRIKVQLDTGEIINDISLPITWIVGE